MENKTYAIKNEHGFILGYVNAERAVESGNHIYFYTGDMYVASFSRHLVQEVSV